MFLSGDVLISYATRGHKLCICPLAKRNFDPRYVVYLTNIAGKNGIRPVLIGVIARNIALYFFPFLPIIASLTIDSVKT